MLDNTHSKDKPYRATFLFVILYYLVAHGRIHTVVPVLAKFPCAMIVGVLAVCAFWFESRGQEVNYYLIREEKLIAGLAIWCLVTLPTSIWPSNTFFALQKNYLPTIVLIFITGIICKDIDDIRRLIWVYIVNCALIMFVALSNDLNHFAKDVSDSYDVNDIAMILDCSLPIIFQFMLQSRGIKKLILIAVIAVTILTVLKTGSRGGVLGLGAFAIYLISCSNKKFLYAVVTIVSLLVILMFAPAETKERIESMYNPQTEYDKNLGDRTQIWENGLKLFIKSPILGSGFNNYSEADGRSKEAGEAWRTAHNSLLQISVELGIVGLFLFIKLTLGTFIKLRKLRKNMETLGSPSEVLWVISGIEGCVLVYMITALFLSQAYNRQFYFIIALSIAAQKIIFNDEFKRSLDKGI